MRYHAAALIAGLLVHCFGYTIDDEELQPADRVIPHPKTLTGRCIYSKTAEAGQRDRLSRTDNDSEVPIDTPLNKDSDGRQSTFDKFTLKARHMQPWARDERSDRKELHHRSRPKPPHQSKNEPRYQICFNDDSFE